MANEERTGTLFEIDVLAPHEFAGSTRAGQGPEERLMLAVLSEALSCIQKYHRASDKQGRKIFAEAEDWILDDSEQWLFSFTNICATLGISPGYLRRRLALWKLEAPRRRQNESARQVRTAPRANAGAAQVLHSKPHLLPAL